jgi:hypothetical protein
MKTLFDLNIEQRKKLYMDIVLNWNNMSIREMAEKWDLKVHVVQGIAGRLRRAGVGLVRKSRDTILTPNFVEQLKTYLK